MDGFEVYMMYLALKQHFSKDDYDYIKYNGKVKANKNSFLKRKDRYFFTKISRMKQPFEYLLANFVERGDFYVGHIDDQSEKALNDMLGRQQRLTYNFQQDISQMELPFRQHVKSDGQHPNLLVLHLQNKVSKETMIIINQILGGNMFSYWNDKIEDPIIWPTTHKVLKKYAPFLKYDKAKFKKIFVDHFGEL